MLRDNRMNCVQVNQAKVLKGCRIPVDERFGSFTYGGVDDSAGYRMLDPANCADSGRHFYGDPTVDVREAAIIFVLAVALAALAPPRSPVEEPLNCFR